MEKFISNYKDWFLLKESEENINLLLEELYIALSDYQDYKYSVSFSYLAKNKELTDKEIFENVYNILKEKIGEEKLLKLKESVSYYSLKNFRNGALLNMRGDVDIFLYDFFNFSRVKLGGFLLEEWDNNSPESEYLIKYSYGYQNTELGQMYIRQSMDITLFREKVANNLFEYLFTKDDNYFLKNSLERLKLDQPEILKLKEIGKVISVGKELTFDMTELVMYLLTFDEVESEDPSEVESDLYEIIKSIGPVSIEWPNITEDETIAKILF